MSATPAAEQQTDPIPALLDAAFGAGADTAHETFIDLDRQLRAEIIRLVQRVERLAGSPAIKHRSREWYACDSALTSADHAQVYQLGAGPTANALHVAELARRVRELQQVLDNAGGVRS